MGQVGATDDNAATESFFALLQKNVLDCERWRNREELRVAIIARVERAYHRRRRQARLGRSAQSSTRPSGTPPQTSRPDTRTIT